MPQEGELLGRVIKLVGGDNIIVRCTDGKVRTCRIRGKIKRRMWIREHDLGTDCTLGLPIRKGRYRLEIYREHTQRKWRKMGI